MRCVSCNAEIDKNAAFCTNCGAKQLGSNAQLPVNQEQPTKFSRIFVSPKEKFICVLGNNYAERFLANGGLSKGFAILSDKRVYFKGTCFTRDGKKFTQTNEERTVDIKDITGTGFIYEKAVNLLLSAIVFSLLAPFSLQFIFSDSVLMMLGLLGPIMPIILWVAYFRSRQTLFQINYAGGGIAFDTAWLNQNEIQDFQRNIRLAKDAYEERQEVQPAASVAPVAAMQKPTSDNIAEELKKYKDLLDTGVISKDEFETAKSKLLGKL